MKKNCDYPFKVLQERAADSDAFSGATHDSAAAIIRQIIAETEQNPTIGLEGSLGSGKSTVINLLQKKIERDSQKSKEIAFFTFDAWAHAGDSLRRAFLIELTTALIDHTGDPEKRLSKKINEMLKRERTVNRNVNRSTTNLATLIAFAAIFVPVGAGILSGVDYSSLIAPWPVNSGVIYWPLVFGLSIALVPLISVIVYWTFFSKSEPSEGVAGRTKKWNLLREANQETVQETLSFAAEPTSVEFELDFKNVIEIAFEKTNTPSKLVVVLDNLDRIESNDLKNVWSTLQTFFSEPDFSTWQSNLGVAGPSSVSCTF